MFYNRRAFIANSFGVSVACLAPSFLNGGIRNQQTAARGGSSVPALPGRKFTLSLNPFLIGVKQSFTQRELCAVAHRHGFESMSVLTDDLMKRSAQELEGLVADMQAKDMGWGVSFLYVEYRKDQETYRQGMAQLPAMAKVLQQVGANRMMTYIMSNHDELNYLQNFRQTATRLREIAGILADHDLRLGLEYVGPRSIWSANRFPFIHTMAETKELIAAIGQPNVGFHLDTAHWFTSGEGVDDLKTLENKDIVGCDLNDAIKGIGWQDQPGYRRELPLATGVIDTKAFLDALVSIGYDGPIQAEPFNEALNDMEDEQAIEATAQAMKASFMQIKTTNF